MRLIRTALAYIGAALFFGVASIAFAQEAAKIATFQQLGFSVYELIIAPLLAVAIPYLGVHLANWLKAKTKNELIGGTIARFTESVFAGVKLVNQTLRDAVVKAKDPASPGGTDITKEEAAGFNKAVWDVLKLEYGGMAGLEKALSALGLTGGALESFINTRIEAAVHDTKAATAAPLP